jgi:hypothetical protein
VLWRKTLILTSAAVVVATIAAACTDNTNQIPENSSSVQSQAVAAAVQYIDMKYALIDIERLPIHEMDEQVQGGTINNEYVPTARALSRLSALADWSPELAEQAATLHGDAVTLLKALEEGMVEGAKAPSQAVHEDWHMFLADGWDVIAKRLPPEEGGPKGPAAQGEETPAANVTPGANKPHH